MRPAARLNTLDRAIGYFAPTWAKSRAASRLALSSYQAGVERTGASNKGSLANWRPRLLSRYQEELQRKTLTQRARDLFANDANAASIINSMALSTTGYGLRPQSQPNLEALGVAEDDESRVEQVNAFARRAEMLFRNWSRFADADGRMSFGAFQFLAITRFYVDGEFFMLPVMQPHPRRKIDLAFQSLDSLRICSPRERQSSPNVKDGVLLGTGSSALGYFAANPKDGRLSSAYSEKDFKYIPARLGHRPGILHGFLQTESGQVRGVSILAPAMEVFFNLYDYLDYELLGAILAASFPVAITSQNGPGNNATDSTKDPFEEVEPGRVIHLRPGETAEVLKSSRPSDNLPAFTERLLRAAGAACGQPYERVAKDFSKTNFSSARAALGEAAKGDRLFQNLFADVCCTPVWEMAAEEHYLRGLLDTPKGLPGFYEAMDAWLQVIWIPPPQNVVDPVKAEQARALAIKNRTTTRARIAAEDGQDWEEQAQQQAREKKKAEALGLSTDADPALDKGGLEDDGRNQEEDKD